MEKLRPVRCLLRAAPTAFGLVLLAACSSESRPAHPIFHPGGAQALHVSQADPGGLPIRGEVYVPVYSTIYWGEREMTTELSATISIRNADARQPLVLISVTYYDSLGKPIQQFLDGVMELDPMATLEYVIERRDTAGGSGANFIVDWGSTGPIAEPVMEAIMLGQTGSAGISFVSPGRPIRILTPAGILEPASEAAATP
jgi:hypothetical protein